MGYYSERSLVTARAAVVVYDGVTRKWKSTVTSAPGISLVRIYQRGVEPAYRLVARHIDTRQVHTAVIYTVVADQFIVVIVKQ